jgi:excisionase family DNA binding protein
MNEPVARTVKDFCRAYGVSRPTVYRLLAAGRLQAVKVSARKTLIPEESARAWLSALARTHGCTPVCERDYVKHIETAADISTPQAVDKSKKARQREPT